MRLGIFWERLPNFLETAFQFFGNGFGVFSGTDGSISGKRSGGICTGRQNRMQRGAAKARPPSGCTRLAFRSSPERAGKNGDRPVRTPFAPVAFRRRDAGQRTVIQSKNSLLPALPLREHGAAATYTIY
jgi:hypothetical protein